MMSFPDLFSHGFLLHDYYHSVSPISEVSEPESEEEQQQQRASSRGSRRGAVGSRAATTSASVTNTAAAAALLLRSPPPSSVRSAASLLSPAPSSANSRSWFEGLSSTGTRRRGAVLPSSSPRWMHGQHAREDSDEEYVPEQGDEEEEEAEEEEDDDAEGYASDDHSELPTPVVNFNKTHRSFMSPTPDRNPPASSARAQRRASGAASNASSSRAAGAAASRLGGAVLHDIVNGDAVIVEDERNVASRPRPPKRKHSAPDTKPWTSYLAVLLLFAALVLLFSVILVPSTELRSKSSAIAAFGRSMLQRKEELKTMEATRLETLSSLDSLEMQIAELQREVSRAFGGGVEPPRAPVSAEELSSTLASLTSKLSEVQVNRNAAIIEHRSPGESSFGVGTSQYCSEASHLTNSHEQKIQLTPEELICRHKKMADAIRGVEDTLAALSNVAQTSRPVMAASHSSVIPPKAETVDVRSLIGADVAAKVIRDQIAAARDTGSAGAVPDVSKGALMGDVESVREYTRESLQRSIEENKLKFLNSVREETTVVNTKELPAKVVSPSATVDRTALISAVRDEIKEASRSNKNVEISLGSAIEYSSIMRGAHIYKSSFFSRITDKILGDVSAASKSMFGVSFSFMQPGRTPAWDHAWLTSRPFLMSFNKEVMSKMISNFDFSEVKRYGPKVAKHVLRLTMGWDADQTASDPDVVLSHLFPIEYESADGVPIQPKVSTHEVAPGSCYAFAGASGNISIEFKSPIRPRYVAIYHPPRAHLPPPVPLSSVVDLNHHHGGASPSADPFVGGLTSAPRDFDVLGWTSFPPEEPSNRPLDLGSFSFETGDDNGRLSSDGPEADFLQFFELKNNEAAEPVTAVTFRFRSNNGNPLFTCVYRVKVYGDLEK